MKLHMIFLGLLLFLFVGCASTNAEKADEAAEKMDTQQKEMTETMDDANTASGDKAKQMLIKSPAEGSATYTLAKSYLEKGQIIPGVLSLSRYLIIEPKGTHSSKALKDLMRAMSFTEPIETKEVADKAEMASDDFAMQTQVMQHKMKQMKLEEAANASPREQFARSMEQLFVLLQEGEDQSVRKGFVWEYYVPYFAQLQAKGFTSTFVDYIHQLPDSRMMGMQLDRSEQFAAF
ncbi:MAG: hypothetical protein AAFP70_22510, partial [Calditrichota bacterium]